MKLSFIKILTLVLVAILSCACEELTAENVDLPSTDSEDDGSSGSGDIVIGNNFIPAFLATGHMESSMFSCDGGQTWRGYRSVDPNIRCWDNSDPALYEECDHTPYSNTGIAWGHNGFITSFGWGQPGQVEVTDDGINWSVVNSGSTWAGVSYGNGTYVLNNRTSSVSSDGSSFVDGGDADFIPWNARHTAYVTDGTQHLFIATANSSGTGDLLITEDPTIDFQRPTTLPTGCDNGHIAYGNGTIVLVSTETCLSTDWGENWTTLPTALSNITGLIFDGQEFHAYSRGEILTSTNGSSWSSQSLMVGGSHQASLHFSKVAYHPDTDRWIAFYQAWANYYENTQYYHSTDGINWTQVQKGTGLVPETPHPIRQVTFGYLRESTLCQP